MSRSKLGEKKACFNGGQPSRKPVDLGADRALSRLTVLRRLRRRIVVKLIIQISKGIIRDQRMRRSTMFYVLLVALVMLFAGAVLIDHWLRQNIWFFLLWWGLCAWLTLLAVLLAFFDLLVIRAAVRHERRRLARRLLREEPSETDDADSR